MGFTLSVGISPYNIIATQQNKHPARGACLIIYVFLLRHYVNKQRHEEQCITCSIQQVIRSL